jgi:hypothetical protein
MELTMFLDYAGISQSHVSAGRDLDRAASLRVMLIMRTRKMQLEKNSVPEWVLNNKIKAYEFIDSLNFRRPNVIDSNVRMETISPGEKIVIKPYNGFSSRGVYLGFKENHVYKVKTGELIDDWATFRSHMQNDLSSGAVKEDRWIVEELILEKGDDLMPARDLKFYCFYGHAALVLEIVRFPNAVYCFWDRDKKMVDTGAYLDQLFPGAGFSKQMLEVAEAISLNIPSPFMRIDFHSTGSELVFCEFTPRPGGAWLYSKKVDQLLGDSYLAAEGRLLNDLLAGKKFEAFNNLRSLS